MDGFFFLLLALCFVGLLAFAAFFVNWMARELTGEREKEEVRIAAAAEAERARRLAEETQRRAEAERRQREAEEARRRDAEEARRRDVEAARTAFRAWEYVCRAHALTCTRCGELAFPIPITADRYACPACRNQFVGAPHSVPLPPPNPDA